LADDRSGGKLRRRGVDLGGPRRARNRRATTRAETGPRDRPIGLGFGSGGERAPRCAARRGEFGASRRLIRSPARGVSGPRLDCRGRYQWHGGGRGREHGHRRQCEPEALVFSGTRRTLDRRDRRNCASGSHSPARGLVRARERRFRKDRRSDNCASELALGIERCAAPQRYPGLARPRANPGVGSRRNGGGRTGRAAQRALGRNRARGTAADRTIVGARVGRALRRTVGHSAI
jgi:hypothetical protein